MSTPEVNPVAATALMADFQQLYADGSSDDTLAACSTLMALAPVQQAIATGIEPARAVLALLKMVADEPDASVQVRAGAAVTGIDPRHVGRGVRNDPGPIERRDNARKIDPSAQKVEDDTLRKTYSDWYFPPLARAVLGFLTELDMSDELMAEYLTRCKPSNKVRGNRPESVPSSAEQPQINYHVRETHASYIRRPQLEARFRDLVSSGAKLIVLVGKSGTGKTALAEALTGGAPTIRVRSGEPQKQDFVYAFQAKIDPKTIQEVDSAILFAQLVAGPEAPEFVTVDVNQTAEQLSSFIPHNDHKSIIVVTCRAVGDWDRIEARCVIDVENMELAEAQQLVSSLLPGASSQDAHFVASTFDRYPLAIKLVCRGLLVHGIDLRSFCEEASRWSVGDGKSREAVVRPVLQRIASLATQHDPLAQELLVCLSASDLGLLRTSFLIRYLERSSGSDLRSFDRCQQALQTLVDFSLVKITSPNGELDLKDSDGLVSMHDFVHDVYKEEYRGQRMTVWRQTYEVCAQDLQPKPPRRRRFSFKRHRAAQETDEWLNRLTIEQRTLIHTAQAIIVPPLQLAFELFEKGANEAELEKLDELDDLYDKFVDTYLPIQLNLHPYPNILIW